MKSNIVEVLGRVLISKKCNHLVNESKKAIHFGGRFDHNCKLVGSPASSIVMFAVPLAVTSQAGCASNQSLDPSI